MWYKRRECGIRMAIFFSAATAAGAFGGLLARAIMFLDGKRGLKAWSWIFIIEGAATILIGMSPRTPLCFLYMWLVYQSSPPCFPI
jgi:hypothetical protein